MSNTVDPCIVAGILGVLVPISDCLARWIDDLGFSAIGLEAGLHPILA